MTPKPSLNPLVFCCLLSLESPEVRRKREGLATCAGDQELAAAFPLAPGGRAEADTGACGPRASDRPRERVSRSAAPTGKPGRPPSPGPRAGTARAAGRTATGACQVPGRTPRPDGRRVGRGPLPGVRGPGPRRSPRLSQRPAAAALADGAEPYPK
uniref:Uncharacterized protein n=1 Tax=Rousettus aegyptiacus TaxID=9407 RepID=A0A7J8DI44_ROUAE|nr:hypothetical protein HJG63_008700 [Rousettus aegyptiacus]